MASNSNLLSIYLDLKRRIDEIDVRQGGPQGPRGKKGDQGVQGKKGDQGPKGEKGDRGPVGPQGAGKPGRDGKDGKDGKDGQRGPTGPAGMDGRDGVDGADGADGVGISGASVDFDGHLYLDLTNGESIDVGLVREDAEGQTIVYTGGSGGSGDGGGSGPTPPHNDLDGLQGNGPDYYHLNEAEWTTVVDWINNGIPPTSLPTFAGAGTSGIVPNPVTETGKVLFDDGTWQQPSGLETVVYTSDATSDPLADVALAWNDYADRTNITRLSNQIIFFRWPGTSDDVYQYIGNQSAPPWTTSTNDWVNIGGGSVSWGTIIGDINNQTDLANALRQKGAVGLDYTFTNDTAATDPGNGGIKLNNADQSLATEMYVSKQSGLGNDLSRYWDGLQQQDNFNLIEVNNEYHFVGFEISGPIVDNGTWYTVPVTNLEAVGAIDNGAAAQVYWTQDTRTTVRRGGTTGQVYAKVDGGLNYEWVDLPAAGDFDHNSLTGLEGTGPEYIHLNQVEFDRLSDGTVESVTGTAPIAVDNTDPQNPIVSLTEPLDYVQSVTGTAPILVDNTDPFNPIVEFDSGVIPTIPDHDNLTGVTGTGPEYIHINAAEQTLYDGYDARITTNQTDIANHVGDLNNPHQTFFRDLEDTAVDTPPATNDLLTWDGANWINIPRSDLPGGITDHTQLTSIGVNTHDQIDAHIADVTTNPHNVTYAQLPDTPTEFPPAAHTLGSHSDVDVAGVINGSSLIYNSTSGNWENFNVLRGLGEEVVINSSAASPLKVEGTGVSASISLTGAAGIDNHFGNINANGTAFTINAITPARFRVALNGTIRLDINDATSTASWNGTRLTNLLDPVDPQDALTKAAGDLAYAPLAHTLDSHSDVSVPTPDDGERLAWDAIQGLWVPRRSTSALGIVALSYRWTTPVSTTPATGRVSTNNADPTLVTEVYINEFDDSGNDNSIYFDNIGAGDWFNVIDRQDDTNTNQYDVTGDPVLAAGVYTIPVVYFASAGPNFSNNEQVAVFIRYTASGVTDHTDLTNIGVNTHAQIDTHIAATNNPHSVTYAQLPDVPTEFPPAAHTHDTADIVSGTFADARIAQSNVTQHQAALSIAGSQLTGTVDGGTY